MGPRFDNPVLDLANGKLEVKGTFDTAGEVMDNADVVVRFLIIRDGHPVPIIDRAWIVHADLQLRTHNGDTITHGEFSKVVDNTLDLQGGEVVRGIGLAVAVKKPDNPSDPPAFETFTWCVNLVAARP